MRTTTKVGAGEMKCPKAGTACPETGEANGMMPALMLAVSAALWGTTWYPFRLLAQGGIDGLSAIVLTEMAAMVVCVLIFGRQLLGMRVLGPLLPIGVLGGICNTGYVMGAIHGEVLRVTLLLYLAPLWTVFLAHWVLKERVDRVGAGVVILSMIGAAVMLWPFSIGAKPFGLPDLWGLVAGLTYAGYNVMVRKHLELSVPHKAFSAAAGSALVAVLWWISIGGPTLPAKIDGALWALVVATGLLLVVIVVLMQRGLEQIPASRAIVILVLELVFAALSAWWLADEVPGLRELAGGILILGASLLAARSGEPARAPRSAPGDAAAR